MKGIRRVVTGHDAQGRSRVIFDGIADTVVEMGYDSRVHELWLTREPLPSNKGSEDAARAAPTLRTPPRAGDKFRVVEFAPDEKVDREAMDERLERNLRAGRMKGSSRGHLHRTETLDYSLVLRGEIWHRTELDEVHLAQGDVLIQRGTYHSWENRSSEPAFVAFVMRDAQPLECHEDRLEAECKAEVEAALHRWIAAMNARRGLEPLMPLYDRDAALFATHNPALLVTPEARAGNFAGLTDRQREKDYRAVLGGYVTRVFSDAAVITGYYSFNFTDGTGKPVVNDYRFSFTYRRAAEGWLIVSHHSSPKPEKNLSPRPRSGG